MRWACRVCTSVRRQLQLVAAVTGPPPPLLRACRLHMLAALPEQTTVGRSARWQRQAVHSRTRHRPLPPAARPLAQAPPPPPARKRARVAPACATRSRAPDNHCCCPLPLLPGPNSSMNCVWNSANFSTNAAITSSRGRNVVRKWWLPAAWRAGGRAGVAGAHTSCSMRLPAAGLPLQRQDATHTTQAHARAVARPCAMRTWPKPLPGMQQMPASSSRRRQ